MLAGEPSGSALPGVADGHRPLLDGGLLLRRAPRPRRRGHRAQRRRSSARAWRPTRRPAASRSRRASGRCSPGSRSATTRPSRVRSPMRSRWVPLVGLSLARRRAADRDRLHLGRRGGRRCRQSRAPTRCSASTAGSTQHGAELGSPDAPVTISIFNDLQCTDCADYQLETVPPLIEELVRAGDAQLEFRHRSVGQKVDTARPRWPRPPRASRTTSGSSPTSSSSTRTRSETSSGVNDQFLERVAPDDPGPRVRRTSDGKRDREAPEVIEPSRVRRPDRGRPRPCRAGGRRGGPGRQRSSSRTPPRVIRDRGRGRRK